MRNLPLTNMSTHIDRPNEDRFSTDVLDRKGTFQHQNISWRENHLDNKMAIIRVDNSPRRDGGICKAILHTLINSPELSPCIDIIDCSRGGLLNTTLSQGYQYAWILDTVNMGLSPGKWLCFKPTKGVYHRDALHSYMTLHYGDVAEAIALGDALGLDLPKLEIYCIQPLPLEESECVSTLAEKVVLEVYGSILCSLKRRLIENGEDISR